MVIIGSCVALYMLSVQVAVGIYELLLKMQIQEKLQKKSQFYLHCCFIYVSHVAVCLLVWLLGER